jgi:hypothetical protein
MDKKSFPIGASGCPLATMAVKYCKPLLTFEIGGVFNVTCSRHNIEGLETVKIFIM